MVAAQVLTWTADPAAPHDVLGDASFVLGAAAGILPTSGDRSLPMFDVPNGLLPVGVWGDAGYSAMDDSGIVMGFPPSLPFSSLAGGGARVSPKDPKDLSSASSPKEAASASPKEAASASSPKEAASASSPKEAASASSKEAKQWLRRAGFAAVAADTPDGAVVKLRARAQTIEDGLSRNPATSMSIVLGADWRVVGEYLSAPKNAATRRMVEAALRERADGFRMNRDPTASKTELERGILRKFQDAVRSGTGVQASFNDGEASATFDLAKGGTIRRLVVTDLRLSPTLGFVARLARDIGIKFTGKTAFVVDGETLLDPALAAFLASFGRK